MAGGQGNGVAEGGHGSLGVKRRLLGSTAPQAPLRAADSDGPAARAARRERADPLQILEVSRSAGREAEGQPQQCSRPGRAGETGPGRRDEEIEGVSGRGEEEGRQQDPDRGTDPRQNDSDRYRTDIRVNIQATRCRPRDRIGAVATDPSPCHDGPSRPHPSYPSESPTRPARPSLSGRQHAHISVSAPQGPYIYRHRGLAVRARPGHPSPSIDIRTNRVLTPGTDIRAIPVLPVQAIRVCDGLAVPARLGRPSLRSTSAPASRP